MRAAPHAACSMVKDCEVAALCTCFLKAQTVTQLATWDGPLGGSEGSGEAGRPTGVCLLVSGSAGLPCAPHWSCSRLYANPRCWRSCTVPRHCTDFADQLASSETQAPHSHMRLHCPELTWGPGVCSRPCPRTA